MSVAPLCPIYELCGGCQYQHLSYPDELSQKSARLNELLHGLNLPQELFSPVLPSPEEYHYRNRLDLKLHRFKDQSIQIGFSPFGRKGIIPMDSCAIARPEINAFIPQLKAEALAKVTPKYRQASLVLRSGDGKNTAWGGLGHGSLKQNPKDYFWTDILGRRIHYSLETFFQANLSILPSVMQAMRALPIWSKESVFFDLYGGVGLFGICFADLVDRVVLIEEVLPSVTIARHNAAYNKLDKFDAFGGKVEDVLSNLLDIYAGRPKVVMVDPPRAGLSSESVKFVNELESVKHLLYLSCHPESLALNLRDMKDHWKVEKIIPMDFFPKTRHLETLVLLHSLA